MRPVRVTAPGASLVAAAAHGGRRHGRDGRHHDLGRGRRPLRAAEFPVLSTSRTATSSGTWSTSSSNYTTLRAQNEAELSGKGWEIESSLTLNQQLITNVILSGGKYYGGGGFGGRAAPSDASRRLPPGRSADAGADAARADAPSEVRDGRHRGALRRHDRPERSRHAHAQRHLARRDDDRLRPRGVARSVGDLEHPQRDPEREPRVPRLRQFLRTQWWRRRAFRNVPHPRESSGGSSVATGGGASANGGGGGGGGGCVASPQSSAGSVAGFGAIAALLGLALVRVRTRRRSARAQWAGKRVGKRAILRPTARTPGEKSS